MSQQPNVRKQVIVNKPLQSRIVLAVSWPAASCIMLAGLIFMTFCLRLGFEAAEAELALPSLPTVLGSAVAFLALATTALLYNALRFSHRIAGPAYRIEKTLETFMAGDHTVRAKLRQHDHLQELAASVNRFLEWSATAAPAAGTVLSVVHLAPEAHDDIGLEEVEEVETTGAGHR